MKLVRRKKCALKLQFPKFHIEKKARKQLKGEKNMNIYSKS